MDAGLAAYEGAKGVSDNKWRFWDISNARELVGYAPRDDAERWREG